MVALCDTISEFRFCSSLYWIWVRLRSKLVAQSSVTFAKLISCFKMSQLETLKSQLARYS